MIDNREIGESKHGGGGTGGGGEVLLYLGMVGRLHSDGSCLVDYLSNWIPIWSSFC